MTYKKPKTTKPVSIRLSPEELSTLLGAAGKRTLSEFVRERLFGEAVNYRQTRNPKSDARLLAQLLARLGQSEIAANLRDLDRAVQMGTLPVTPDVEKALRLACADVAEIRARLIRALGLPEGTAE